MMTRSIVNGNMLRNFTGKRVSIMVNIHDVDASGRVLSGKTTDDQMIKINLSEPTSSIIHGWVDVIGNVTGSDRIQCDEVILFEEKDGAEPFDTDGHNMLVTFLNNVRDVYKTG